MSEPKERPRLIRHLIATTVGRVSLLTMFCLGFLPLAFGQVTAGPPRMEVSGGIGFTSAKPVVQVCCTLRTPPFYQQLDDAEGMLLLGAGLRIHETRALSTAVRFNWGQMNEVSLKYPDSSASTPFTSYIAERLVRPRSFTLSVSESIDFLPKDRVRPYLSAGVALSRLSWKQENTSLDLADPTFRQVETDSWSFWRWGFTLDGGVRFYSAGHFMVDAQGGLLLLRDKQERTPNAAAWLVKRENPLFLSVQAGVAF